MEWVEQKDSSFVVVVVAAAAAVEPDRSFDRTTSRR